MSVVTFKIYQTKPSRGSSCSSVGSKAYLTWRDETEKNQPQPQYVKHDEKGTAAPRLCLPFITSTLFASLIEDCITQMRILSECNNELRIMKTMADMGVLRALKFQVKQQEDEDELSKINPKELDCSQYKLVKLFSDRNYIIDVLQQTYLDLSLNRCFTSISDSNKMIEDRDEYRFKLAEEEARNKTLRREMRKELRQKRIHIKSVIYDTNLTIDQLKCQVEDTELNSEIRSRFVENWQLARTEQHGQTILDEESGPSNNINYYRERADQEQRIHSEVELLVNIFINDILTKVDNWMTKYDIDIEAKDLEVTLMKNKYQDAMQKRKNLEAMYANHEKLMKDWIQFKADRQEALNYTQKMINSAIIVQAWWRGLLVRLQMGPYKPTKKKPKQPKPEAAEKKKKGKK